MVKRAWTLYIAHIFLFVVFSAQVGYSARRWRVPTTSTRAARCARPTRRTEALFEALTLRYQPSLLNILPLYVVLLLMFALALPLLRCPRLLAALSVALYVGGAVRGLNLPSWTGGGWFFDPFAWQLLFVGGAILATIRAPAAAAAVAAGRRLWRS